MIIYYRKYADTGGVVVKRFPKAWGNNDPVYDITYCCRPVARDIDVDNIIVKEQDPPTVSWIDKDKHDREISFCPYCGEKIQAEREI
jgi:hypothetical protein